MSGDAEAVAAECDTINATVGERGAGVATVELSRPDARNAMNAQLREELMRVLDAVEASDVRVVVLTGDDAAGAFAAGADVNDLHGRTPLEHREASGRPRVYDAVADLRQPVVARVNGLALGGGCELAMAADVRVASSDTRIGLPEITLGIMPGGGGTQRLPRLVGQGIASRMIFTGEILDADEAAEAGLLDEVHDPDDLDERVNDIAGSIAEKSPVALSVAKRAIAASAEMDLAAGIDHEAELFAQLLASEDAQEGLAAFLEDRDPEWQGR